jgi:hypothetical protein
MDGLRLAKKKERKTMESKANRQKGGDGMPFLLSFFLPWLPSFLDILSSFLDGLLFVLARLDFPQHEIFFVRYFNT